MGRLFFCLALLIMHACAQLQASRSPDPTRLAAQLRQTIADLDSQGAASVLAGLPSTWETATSEHQYSISTEPLRSLLASGEKNPNRIRQARQWLDQLAQQLESYSNATMRESVDPRRKLDRILARSEFSTDHSPSAWDLFRERVAAWIQSLLQRFVEFAAQHPTGGQILFWVLLVGLVGTLAAWLIRFWTRRDPTLSLPPGPAIRRINCDAWLRDAREAAAKGDLREAIRCTYWAAVTRLQEDRVLPADLTRTPREYLHLLSRPTLLEPLTALTNGLERFWYGGQAANLEDFQASLKQLEATGCRLD